MDIADIAEKESGKKAAATGAEQPAKKVKNNEVSRGKWNGPNFARALLQSGISGDACKMGLYIYANQGEKWKFYVNEVMEQTGLSKKKYYSCLTELEDVKAVGKRIHKRIGSKNEAGVKLKWNFDYQSWEPKAKETKTKKTKTKNNPQNGNVQNGNVQNGNVQNGNVQNEDVQNGHCITIDKHTTLPPGNSEYHDKGITSFNSEHREKGEGAAAEPQPAPALPEGAQPPEKAASQESSFPETAQGQKSEKSQIPLTVPEVMKQGQTDLFGEAAPLSEKPKGKRKMFTPPTLAEVVAEIGKQIAGKEKLAMWTSDQIRDFAESFITHNTIDPDHQWENNKGKKIVSWRRTLATWLGNVDYLPPERTTRNQPQRKKSYEHLKEHKGAVLEAESRTIAQN